MNMPSPKYRLLVFVLAYQAERFIEGTLRRIPIALSDFDTVVLVIDDASSDRTFEIAAAIRDKGDFPFSLVVLRNPVNQGYGGNIKLGIQYAIHERFDAIALIHGDGQYPPELIPEPAQILARGEADAVFGSRMSALSGALKGGMPLYKFAGNLILTFMQNRLLGTKLSEFHSGFRVYSVAALRRVPFTLASNYFDFDTDIIVQLLAARMTIREMPIPTRYGEEISHVNVLRYGFMILRSTLAYWAQKRGLYYRRKFDLEPDAHERRYLTPRTDYPEAHARAAARVPAGARVLDIGSGDAIVSRALKEKGCHVTGIDRVPPVEPGRLDAFIARELDRPLAVRFDSFDRVLLLDVLSFCPRPERIVEELHSTSSGRTDGRLIVTTGNVGFLVTRLQLLFGFLNYARRGLIHVDHCRLFTLSSIVALLEDHGFRVEAIEATPAPYAQSIGDGLVAGFLTWLNRLLIRISPSLFGYRLLIEASPRPSLASLLDATISSRSSGAP